MKKFLLILLLIIVGAAGVLGFMFYQAIDEKSYQEQIINSTQQLLGRKLQVNGQLSINLFPSPVITLTDVSVLNPQGFKNKNLIHIEKVEARVQFSSLFKNPLLVDNITLINPRIFLEKNAEGRINWDFTFIRPDNRRISQDNLLGQKANEVPPQFQNIDIKGGSITYLNQPMEESWSFSDVTGQLKANTIKGPFDFKGQIKVDNMPIETVLHIDALGGDVETKFSVSLSAPNSKASLSVQTGKIARLAEPTQEVSGSFALTIPYLSDFLVDLKGYKDLPLELNKKITGTGQFLLSSKQISLDDLAFVYGDINSDIATSGKITLTYPVNTQDKKKTDVLLKFSQLNVDLLSVYMPEKANGKNLFEKISQLLPDNLDFFVSSAKLTLAGGQISDVSLKGRYRDNVMSLFDFSAILPEKVDLTAKGDITTDTQNPNAKLLVAFNGKDLTQVFNWIKVQIPFVKNPAALHDTSITAQLEMTPDNLTFKNINAKIADSQISGALSFSLTAPKLTAYTELNVKSLNFDNLVPYESAAKKQSIKEALKNFKTYLESSVLFSDVDVQFNLQAHDVAFKNLPIQKLSFKGSVKQNEWTTEELDIKQMATADIRYSGTMRKDANNSLVFDNVNASIDIPKASIFFDRLKVETPINSTVGKLAANATLNGSFDQMDVKGQTSIAQGKIQVEGRINDILLENSPYQLQTKIVFPSLTQFVRLFEPTYKGHPNLTGAFNFDGTISKSTDTLSFKDAALTVGPQKLNFSLDIKDQDPILKVAGNISSPWLYMDKFVVEDSAPSSTQYSKSLLDFSSLDNLLMDVRLSAQKASWENFELDDLSSHVLLDQKILQIQDTKAKVSNGEVSFNSNLNFSASTPYLKGQFGITAVPVKPNFLSLGSLRLKQGIVSFSSVFDAKGNSVDDMLRSLSANGRFDIQKGIVSSINLPSFERRSQAMVLRTDIGENMTKVLQREFFSGETAFDELAGTYAVTNGLLHSTDTSFKCANANAMMQIDWNIPQKNLTSSMAFSFKNLAGYPPVSLTVRGGTRNPQTTVDLSSFVKYIESSASDAKNEQIRRQREEETARRQKETASRVEKMTAMVQAAEEQLEQAQKAYQLAPSEKAETQLIRANDAYVLLKELSSKASPSEADLAKASMQASQIATRTEGILSEVNERAGNILRAKIEASMMSAQKQLDAITRVYQRLGSVEIVYQAYQKASASFVDMQQINARTLSDSSLMSLQNAAEQIEKQADIIDLTYQSISKYDIDAAQPQYYDQAPSMQGSIRRN